MKPLNLYRSDGDQPVWEQAERDAKAAELSLSAYVVAVLREHTAMAAIYTRAIAAVRTDSVDEWNDLVAAVVEHEKAVLA